MRLFVQRNIARAERGCRAERGEKSDAFAAAARKQKQELKLFVVVKLQSKEVGWLLAGQEAH